jgi:hypothetical protein
MSMSVLGSPGKRGRVDAMYRLSPSGDWIGHPSWDRGVFSSLLVPGTLSAFTAGAHGDGVGLACAAVAVAAKSARAAVTARAGETTMRS